MMDLLSKYFVNLSAKQIERFTLMETLYRDWNAMINVISRKDIDQFNTRHLLHSLSIAKVVSFMPGTCIMDAGTGGGFPGMPLAIMFPDVHFTLVDSIGKKIKVIDSIAKTLELENVVMLNSRFESVNGSFDFITGRAVSGLPLFASMVRKNINRKGSNNIPNGVLYLTGGEVEHDLSLIKARSATWDLAGFFSEDYFKSKKLIHLHNFS